MEIIKSTSSVTAKLDKLQIVSDPPEDPGSVGPLLQHHAGAEHLGHGEGGGGGEGGLQEEEQEGEHPALGCTLKHLIFTLTLSRQLHIDGGANRGLNRGFVSGIDNRQC